jgi:uncharacterized protein YacL
METPATDRTKRQTSHEFSKKLYKLTVAGGIAFWIADFAISLSPIAAEYMAAFSISSLPMALVEALVGGLIIACFVSYFLLRFFDKIPTKHPILKSVILSFAAIVVIEVLSTFGNPSNAYVYLLIDTVMNIPRILFLGIVIGYLYDRLNGRAL